MKISWDMLREVSRALSTVQSEFSSAEQLTDEWRALVGHGGLAGQLDDFSGNWNDTRENMLESLEQISTLAADIAQVFEDLDNDLADSLQKEG